MLVFGLLSVFLVVATCDEDRIIKQCLDSCSSSNKVACENGCKIAHALTLAPKDYAHNPSCHDSCKSMLAKTDEQEACIFGCDHFGDNNNADLWSALPNFFQHCRRRLMDVFHRLREAIHPTPEVGTPEAPNNNDGIVKTHIRLFIFSNPTFDNKPDDEFVDENAHSMENSLFAPKVAESSSLDSSVFTRKQNTDGSNVGWQLACRLHRVLTNPLKLLFALTLVALFFLLLTQTVLHMRRRRHRSHGYQYTALPTYAEAVEVKIPFDKKDFQEQDKMCVEKQEEQLKA